MFKKIKRIKIGRHVWKIKRVARLTSRSGCYGICDYDNRTIELDASLGDYWQDVTLTHEILHAVLHEAVRGRRKISRRKEEVLWEALDGPLYGALRQLI